MRSVLCRRPTGSCDRHSMLPSKDSNRSARCDCRCLGRTNCQHLPGRGASARTVPRIAEFVSSEATPSDLVLVHSIPSGVLGIARYANPSLNITSWVQQLGNRKVPDSLLALGRGRSRLLYVKVHQLNEPAPEEEWLRLIPRHFVNPALVWEW